MSNIISIYKDEILREKTRTYDTSEYCFIVPISHMEEIVGEIERLQVNVQALRSLLMVVLDAVDYTAGNCRPNETVGAVLPQEVIKLVKQEAK